VELTRIRMNAIADEARAILDTFPEGEARTTLDQFLNFVVTRTK
jgi:geranylgeranyl pyrophosphate synthase